MKWIAGLTMTTLAWAAGGGVAMSQAAGVPVGTAEGAQAGVPLAAPLHPTQPGPAQVASEGSAVVGGAVLDTAGQPVPDAKVTLAGRGRFDERTTTTGVDGRFQFSGLPPEQFRLTVAAAGFETTGSAEFEVHAGQVVTAPQVTLRVTTATASIDVSASPDQVAEAQVDAEEKQRVLGIFPNFYTSYLWKAEPLPSRLKYRLAVRSLIDPVTFLTVAGVAGAEQFNGTYPGYGPGIGGYGKRYGAAYGDALTERLIAYAILPSVFHQDPRYFYQGSGSVASRTRHAVASSFITRGDNGKTQINYSHLLGGLAAGAIANAYHPASSRGVGLTFQTFGITTAGNVVGNLVREFILRRLEPAVPSFANGRR